MLGCFVFVRGFAASGDKVVALLRFDLTHLPPMRITLREKSPPIPANLSFVGSNCVYLSPSPQSAPYPVLYTVVYISTALLYSEAFNFLSAKVKEESFNYSRKQILVEKV